MAGYCNAEISLYKAMVYFSVSNIYIALSIKYHSSLTRFNLSLFQNLWLQSLMNVLFNSYHVTAILFLNHSLLDVFLTPFTQTFAELKEISIIKRSVCSTNFGIRNSEFGIVK